MERSEYYEKVLSGEELSFEDKLKIISELVSDKTYKTIMDNAVLAKATWEEISFRVSRDGFWSDETDIWRIMKIIWAKNFSVKSKSDSCNDMWWWTDYYVNTDISFSF